MENALKDIECPFCLDNYSAKIYMCQKGHILCGNCYELIKVCPLCQVPMTTLRNHTLEQLIKKVAEINTPGNQFHLADHQEDCFECASSSQDSSNLQKCLSKLHRTYIVWNQNQGFVYQHLFKNADPYDFVVVQFKGDLFKFCVKMDNTTQAFCFVMQKYDYQIGDDKFVLELRCVFKSKTTFGVVEVTENLEHAFQGPFASVEKERFPQPSPDVIAVKVYCRFKTKATSAGI